MVLEHIALIAVHIHKPRSLACWICVYTCDIFVGVHGASLLFFNLLSLHPILSHVATYREEIQQLQDENRWLRQQVLEAKSGEYEKC